VSRRRSRVASAEWLAGAAAGDQAVLQPALGPAADNIDESGLDVRTHALVRLAGLVAAGASAETVYDQRVTTALEHGVTLDEIAGVLIALLPALGTARITAAAAAVLGAVGRVTAGFPAAPRPEHA
jgi:4-carboxymuconolactone decarboxylase